MTIRHFWFESQFYRFLFLQFCLISRNSSLCRLRLQQQYENRRSLLLVFELRLHSFIDNGLIQTLWQPVHFQGIPTFCPLIPLLWHFLPLAFVHFGAEGAVNRGQTSCQEKYSIFDKFAEQPELINFVHIFGQKHQEKNEKFVVNVSVITAFSSFSISCVAYQENKDNYFSVMEGTRTQKMRIWVFPVTNYLPYAADKIEPVNLCELCLSIKNTHI